MATQHGVLLVDQVSTEPYPGQADGIFVEGVLRGHVFLGRTATRLETVKGKPYKVSWMVNGEAGCPTHADRMEAVASLLRKRASEVEVSSQVEVEAPAQVEATSVSESKPVSAARWKFSPTQIKKYAPGSGSGCHRAWAFKYIGGLPDPSGPAAAFGSAVHTVLENWLQFGKAPDPKTRAGKVASAGLSQLPVPGPNLEVEKNFIFDFNGHLYRGLVDLSYRDISTDIVVHDHKTTSDFGWALTEDELRTDAQGIIYAKQAFNRFDDDVLRLRWLYLKTKGAAKAQLRTIRVNREEIEQGMEVLDIYASEMAEIRRVHLPIMNEYMEAAAPTLEKLKVQKLTADKEVFSHLPEYPLLALEPNAHACGTFGGCTYLDICQLTPRQRTRSIMAQAQKKLSLKERMANRAAKAANSGAAETTQPQAVPDPKIEGATVNPPEGVSEEEAKTVLPEEPKEEKKPAAKKRASRKRTSKKKDATEEAAEEAATESAPPAEAPPEIDTDAPRRGRPVGAKNKPRHEMPQATQVASHVAEKLFGAAVSAVDPEKAAKAASQLWAQYKADFDF